MKILLATDGSASAKSAIDFMLQLPLPEETEVRLLTVVDKEIYHSKKRDEMNKEQRQLLDETKELLLDSAEELLAESEAQLKHKGWQVTTQLLTGHPSKQIVRIAKRLPADLVIVGSHGLTGVERFLLGSVSDQVLAYSPCSVLIVKPHASKPAITDQTKKATPDLLGTRFKLLLAYDDSPSAKLAAKYCANLPLSETVDVKILTVLPLVKLYRQDIKQQLSWVWKEKKKLARKALEKLQKERMWSPSYVTTELRESADVSHEILDVATAEDSDMIILGYKGKGAVEKFLLGSVTRRIAHHAPCSVLVVRGWPAPA